MFGRFLQRCTIYCIAVLGTCASPLASQGLTHPSTTAVFRQQFGSIADEVVGKMPLTAQNSVALTVQAQTVKGAAENAFIEVLRQKGCRTVLGPPRDSATAILNIIVLTEGVVFRDLGAHAFVRTVQTELEARTEEPNGANPVILGTYRRMLQDTVSEKDSQELGGRRADETDEDATFFQRLAGPLIVLASGMMIVYLFFTVRS